MLQTCNCTASIVCIHVVIVYLRLYQYDSKTATLHCKLCYIHKNYSNVKCLLLRLIFMLLLCNLLTDDAKDSHRPEVLLQMPRNRKVPSLACRAEAAAAA